MRVDLMNDQWAQVLDAEQVTSARRKAMFSAVDTTTMPGISINDTLISFLLVSWSFDYACPTVDPKTWELRNVKSLDELAAMDVDAIAMQASKIIKKLTPNFDPNPDRKSPTSPSGD